jgi:hypothetical protein
MRCDESVRDEMWGWGMGMGHGDGAWGWGVGMGCGDGAWGWGVGMRCGDEVGMRCGVLCVGCACRRCWWTVGKDRNKHALRAWSVVRVCVRMRSACVRECVNVLFVCLVSEACGDKYHN